MTWFYITFNNAFLLKFLLRQKEWSVHY